MSAQLVELFKQMAGEQNQASRPVNVLFGTVLTEEPDLSVQLEQKKILTKEFLVLSRNVTDHLVDMTMGDGKTPQHFTEDADPNETDPKAGGSGDPAFASHSHKHSHVHEYKGRKTFYVHCKLLAGEKVILVSVQGGQAYVILDRVGSNLE